MGRPGLAALFAISFAGLAGLIAARSALHADALVHPPRAHVSAAARAQASADVPGLEDVTLRTSDGLLLRGWFAAGSRGASVILVHGWGGSRRQLWPEARLLARHGFGVLVYDARASGESDGNVVSWGDKEQYDVSAALDYVSSRRDSDPARIALLGFSSGGSTIVLEAAHDPRARALIVCATWPSLEEEMRSHRAKYGPLSWGPTLFVLSRAGVRTDDVRPVDRIMQLGPRPLLLLAGTMDEDTPVSVVQRLFDVAAEPKQLWVVPGAHHGGYLAASPDEYEARIVAFLEKSLF